MLNIQSSIRIKRPDDFEPLPVEFKGSTIPAMFERSAERYPGNVALTSNGRSMTFSELNTQVNELARIMLSKCGTGQEPVALLLRQDIGAIVGLLAALKIGRPYLALDTAYPVERIQQILTQSRAAIFLADDRYKSVAAQAIQDQPGTPLLNIDEVEFPEHAENLGIRIDPDSPASIMYTSGSTGEPKGAITSHRHAAITYVTEVNEWFVSPSDRITNLGSISSGRSRSTLFTALITGATACLFDARSESETKMNIDEWLRSESISLLRLPESLFQSIYARLPEGFFYPRIRLVGVGGQMITRRHFDLFRAHTDPECVFINLYYSTECGGLARYYLDHESELQGEVVPVGFAWPDKEIIIADVDGEPVPAGERGQVIIRSANNASGYMAQPALTAEKFKPDPLDPTRTLYHTGDYGKITPEGALQLLGREDSMVKIRGYRIEIAEVESALGLHPDVKTAVVLTRESKGAVATKQLVAYLVLNPGKTFTTAQARAFVGSKLPDYMVPSAFVVLDSMPLTSNGKVDRRALPAAPEREDLSAEDLPSNPIEEKLVAIWCELFNLSKVSVHDNFFELGGDSLTTLSMALEVERSLLKKVPPSFFRNPNIRSLAESLREDEVAKNNTGGAFVLEGHRRLGPRSPLAKLKRWFKESKRGLDETFILEWILFRWIQHLSFQKTLDFVHRLADKTFLWKTVYRRNYNLFARFVNSLGMDPQKSAELFRSNLINNYLFKLVDGRRPFSVPRINSGSDPSHASVYARGRQRVVDSTTIEQLDEHFPVEGFQHLEAAYREKHGVILLSFHGTGLNRIGNGTLARRLGSPPFQTIAHNTALKQSHFWGTGLRRVKMPASVEASMYAELAYHGQRLLQQGEVIHIAGDLGKGPGRTYPVRIGDRLYEFKAGFAELALNTGSKVIPVYGRYVPPGKLLISLQPPLKPGTGNREEQLQALIQQYADFINNVIMLHPEILAWHKMRNHLRQPHAHRDPANQTQ